MRADELSRRLFASWVHTGFTNKRNIMKQLLFILGMAIILSFPAHAQTASARNNVFIEAGGTGLLLSLNCEHIAKSGLGFRFGLGGLVTGGSSNSGDHTDYFAAPLVMVVKLFRPEGSSHGLITGAGIVYLGAPAPSFILGYRYSPSNGGFLFQAAFTPLISPAFGFVPWGGIALGYSF